MLHKIHVKSKFKVDVLKTEIGHTEIASCRKRKTSQEKRIAVTNVEKTI